MAQIHTRFVRSGLTRRPDAAVEGLEVKAYTLPTETPESDGTLTWNSTTMVAVLARSGSATGIGYSIHHGGGRANGRSSAARRGGGPRRDGGARDARSDDPRDSQCRSTGDRVVGHRCAWTAPCGI